MRNYKLLLIMIFGFIFLSLVNSFIKEKTNQLKKEIKEATFIERKISIIYTNYKNLEKFIKDTSIKPISKEQAHKRLLFLLEKLKKNFNVIIKENELTKDIIYTKILYDGKVSSSEEIKNFFRILFKTDKHIITSVNYFKYTVEPDGTHIKSIISIYVPFKEEEK